ncbi:LytTR family transcriptional regulator DNA-binding domain-containing protein, partial [Arthrospira platensis SPKY1]|nr:LytTR family transcriptional regulator DNA-binding domain-containing protein [Arthrospira platensis SPKY1]
LSCGWEVVSLKPLAYYQKILLKGLDFFRVHNNALVNMEQISAFNKKDNLLRMKSGAREVFPARKGRKLYFHYFLK